jgi:hypothetical protein
LILVAKYALPFVNFSKRTANMSESTPAEGSKSAIIAMFEGFRDELDEHYDRRERIIKASRDITTASKKMFDIRTHVQKTRCNADPLLQ